MEPLPIDLRPGQVINTNTKSGPSIKLEIDSRFECSICLEYLKDAVLTSCGHKFCLQCIDSWISVNQKRHCPIDEVFLSKEDIFIDNYTRREILETNLACPYRHCSVRLSIPEYEFHVNRCEHRPNASQHTLEPVVDDITNALQNINFESKLDDKSKPRVTIFSLDDTMQLGNHTQPGQKYFYCKFYQVGCKEIFKSETLLDRHYELKTSFHLELLFNLYCSETQDTMQRNVQGKTIVGGSQSSPPRFLVRQQEVGKYEESKPSAQMNGVSSSVGEVEKDVTPPFERNKREIELYLMRNKSEESKLWDPVKQKPDSDEVSNNLMKLLYERIVLLEQSKLELEIKVDKLESQLKHFADVEESNELRFCNGTYFWKIDNFLDQLKEMRENNKYLYSSCFYSSVYGYRFCTRMNISREDPEYLSLFIHLVQGEHDHMLAWPFIGKIIFTAMSAVPEKCIQDEIQSNRNLDSFKRPLNYFFNKKAFGFNNFIRTSDVLDAQSAFLVENNMFIIKTQIVEGLP